MNADLNKKPWHGVVGVLLLLAALIIALLFMYYENIFDKCFLMDKKDSDSSIMLRLDHIDKLNFLSPALLTSGIEEMAKHKLLIVGITRDNAEDIQIAIKQIEYTGSFFKDYRVVLFENDSIDDTKILLNNWQANNDKVKIISKNYGNRKRPNHKFMADVRNNYLNAIESQEYKEFDLVMMIDLDMKYGFDMRGVQNSFAKINKWDAVCANGIANSKGMMYDAFAFRNVEFPWSPSQWNKICTKNDATNQWTVICNKGADFSKGWLHDLASFRNGWQEDSRLYWLLIMPQVQKSYPFDSDLMPVDSCFGGLAFYKREFIKDCRYDSIDNDCEHIAFHQCLKTKNHGKMFMNPAQVIRYSHYKE